MNKRIHGQWQGKEVERARHQQLNVSSGSDVRHFSLYSLAKASHMVIFNFKEKKNSVLWCSTEEKGTNHVLVNNQYLPQHAVPNGDNGLQPTRSCCLEMGLKSQFDTVSIQLAR